MPSAGAAGRRSPPAPASSAATPRRSAGRRAGVGGAVPASSSRNDGRPGAVGEHGDAVAAAGDADVEHPALLLDVLGQAVGHDAVGDAEHDDAVPLPALDPVDRRQRDAVGIGLPAGTPPRSHGSKPAGSGCRSATPSRPSRSSRWLEPWPPPVRSSRLIAAPRPTSSRTTSRTSRVVPSRPASTTRRRSSTRRSTLPASLSGTWSAIAASWASVQRARRSSRSGNHCGRPRVGRRRISTTSPAASPSGDVAMRR